MPSRNYTGFTGTFVSFREYSKDITSTPLVGIVTCTDKGNVFIQHYENGYPVQVVLYLDVFEVNGVTPHLALDHFAGVIERLDDEVRTGGAKGAFHARSREIIRRVVEKLNLGHPPYDVALTPAYTDLGERSTGVYVAMGTYQGLLDSPFFQAFSIAHTLAGEKGPPVLLLPEMTISDILRVTHPEGFGDIPEGADLSHGWRPLSGYMVHHVPKESLGIVGKYTRLELILKAKD